MARHRRPGGDPSGQTAGHAPNVGATLNSAQEFILTNALSRAETHNNSLAAVVIGAAPDAEQGNRSLASVLAETDLTQRIEEGRRVAAQLAVASDQLNNKIEQVEFMLNSLQLGVSAYVPLLEHPVTNLWFFKRGDAWGLFVEAPNEIVPLRSASRDRRLLAVFKLPALIDELLKRIRQELSQVEAGIQHLDDVILKLEQVQS